MEDEELLEKKLEGKEEEVPTDMNSSPTDPDMEPTTTEEPADTSSVEEKHEELPPIVEENDVTETSIKTFTQEDVDKLVGDTRVKTREKTFNYVYNRYGVKNEEEMDALVANAQRFDTLKEEHDSERSAWEQEKSATDGKLAEMSEQIALMQSGVDADRYEDVKLILKGKGLDVTLENIQSQLETHPEWKKEEAKEEKADEEVPAASPSVPTVTTRIKTLGNEPKPAPQESEEEKAEKLFKMKFHS